ncbi:MAG: hypothetical protein MHMPM18_004426 [Marteilia pararefringens]
MSETTESRKYGDDIVLALDIVSTILNYTGISKVLLDSGFLLDIWNGIVDNSESKSNTVVRDSIDQEDAKRDSATSSAKPRAASDKKGKNSNGKYEL